MTNRYYSKTGNPVTLTRGTSLLIRNEYTLIEQAADHIQTDMDTKATIDSPALTGIPTAPTAAFGNSSNQLATTAFVASQAFSLNLPGQTGNDGKVLTTDGANAYWGVPPAFAGLRRHSFLAAGSATSAGTSAQEAAQSAAKARRSAFIANGTSLQLQQLAKAMAAMNSRAYFYGNF